MRKQLIEALENLLSDEYDANELVMLEIPELIEKLIGVANYYADNYHDLLD